MINDLGRFISETPPWFRIPLLLLLLLMAGLLTGLCIVLAIAVIQGRGVTAKWSGVEIAPKANACVAFAQVASQGSAASQDLVESLRGQIAELMRQANGEGPNRAAASVRMSELLDKQDEIAKNRQAVMQRLSDVCEKSQI